MTYWNAEGTPLSISSGIAKRPFKEFLKSLNDGSPYWEINKDDEIWPLSYNETFPKDYIDNLLKITA